MEMDTEKKLVLSKTEVERWVHFGVRLRLALYSRFLLCMRSAITIAQLDFTQFFHILQSLSLSLSLVTSSCFIASMSISGLLFVSLLALQSAVGLKRNNLSKLGTSLVNERVVRFMSDISEMDVAITGKCPNAPKCSGAWRERGCDGTGKVQGGLASLPGLGWFGAKVYRPCPAFLEAGYVYRREGQTLDQVLFSEPSSKMKEKMATLAKEKEATEKAAKDKEKETDKNTEPDISPQVELTEAEKFLQERFGED
jgi:hypothetical protein